MEILKIDHLGIAVNSIDDGKNFWSEVLGLKFEGAETVEAQKVMTAFFPVGESEVELLESTSPDGPVAKFIEKKGPGFQHRRRTCRTQRKRHSTHRPDPTKRGRWCQNCLSPPKGYRRCSCRTL